MGATPRDADPEPFDLELAHGDFSCIDYPFDTDSQTVKTAFIQATVEGGMDAGTYFDRIAPIYDAYYEQMELADVTFYRELALDATSEGPVLEVGCGTGRITLELLEAGVDVTGIDVSEGMLGVLRTTAADAGLEPDVRQADVRTFEPRREYALAIVPFRAFLHLLETDDQLAALERVYSALAPGGTLVLNTFTPSFTVICERYGEWERTEVDVEDATYVHRTKTDLVDEVAQVAEITSVIETPDGDSLERSETQIALISKREFDLLFRCSPFEEWSVSGDFEGELLESASQEMVWTARKADDDTPIGKVE